MNILIAINEKYIRQAKMMIYSLKKYNDTNIIIYLIHTELSGDSLGDLRNYIENTCNCEIKIIKIDNERLKELPLFAHYTYEIYYRLLAIDDLLPDDLERILWLDSDIIIKGNIDELYNIDFGKNYLCACEDMLVDSEYLRTFIDVADDSEIQYFNSGVINFNLKEIRNDNKAKELIEFIIKNKDIVQMPDQDALNAIFFGRIKYVESKKYNNLMFTKVKTNREKKEELINIAKIIHYVGPDKPWFYKYLNSSYKYYWEIERENGNRKGYIVFFIKHYIYISLKTVYAKIRRINLYD